MNNQLAREHRWRVVGVFFVVLTARWWLISAAGSPVPFWDQWYSDVHDVRAVADGNFWRGIFGAHNEHRIVFTRLLNRLLLSIDGQWDPLAQMYAAAVIHAAAAALLAGWLSAGLTRTSAGLLAITVAALYALPHAWQNTLWGFQSQFSFLLLFSFACLAWLGRTDGPREWRWWLGLAAGAAANLAMAAGAVTGATLVAVALWELARRRAWHAGAGWRLLAGVGLLTFAWLLRAPVPHHEGLRVASISQFAAVLVSSFAWPHQHLPWIFGLANAPLLFFTARTLARRGSVEPAQRAMFLAGAWGALQAAAFAFARGGAAVESFKAASRYHDLLAVLAAANVLGLLLWWREGGALTTTRRRIAAVLAAAWIVWLAIGLGLQTADVLQNEIAVRRRDSVVHTRLLTALQRGAGDAAYRQLPSAFHIWHPPQVVRPVLTASELADWLPAELQNPVPLTWTEGVPGFLGPERAPEAPVPPAFYPLWGTWQNGGASMVGRAVSTAFPLGSGAHVISCLRGGNPASIQLRLQDAATGRSIVVPIAAVAEGEWREVIVTPGAGIWQVEVSATNSGGFVVFSGPRAIGPLGNATRALQRNRHIFPFLAGLSGLLLLVAALPESLYGAIRSTSRNKSASGAQPRSGNT